MEPLKYSCSPLELELLQKVTLPLNHCSIPSWLLASLGYQRHPIPLEIDGINTWYPTLCQMLQTLKTSSERAAYFDHFMTLRFGLNTKQAPIHDEVSQCRPSVNYRRLLLGWLFDSDNDQGAAWRSWVESRFGLLTLYHEHPVPSPESSEYLQFRKKCTRAIYNTNELYDQLDLLYCFCQQELQLRYPNQDTLTLYRGCLDLPHYQIEHQSVWLFNNLSSFTIDEEAALRFGSKVFSVAVPLTKIACFDSLLPGRLAGEGEFMVLGGLYQATRIRI
ncbi:NAD(+)--dinitrogen-reductase ADP-D-ribosyltransferase [Celerinatantimonas sp. YJH-8]|uniref:NAD(+)--dinitrogen-reductase ADP-D-ribosyltransferase n=1 Tax=Celerinatantimonas sp. YJH-8 TaxID=3228714 RepID=UPI0038C181BE